MSMTSEQISSFSQASGFNTPPSDFLMLFAFATAAVLFLWAAVTARKIGMEALRGKMKLQKLAKYKVRILIIVMLMIYVLSQ